MINDDLKEEIRNVADIVDVVSDKVKLKKSGNGFTGLCPFHNEKTPSFHVSPSLGIYKCFGCGRAGDVFSFVMETDGADFPEALASLAKRYNISIPEQNQDFNDPNKHEREGIFHALKFAASFYHEILRHSDEAAEARAYLKRRGLSRDSLKDNMIGFAKDQWRSLEHAATDAGISQLYLMKAGLIKEPDGGGEPYDTFRNRIMFPIFNITNKVIAFGGRIMGNSKTAKYINSPQTLVYNKSEIIYGLNMAKNEIRKNEESILVEGYMDVLQLHQAGLKNVIASSGTALTEYQVSELYRYGESITMIFDADSAGQNAMKRAIPIALKKGLSVKLLQLPNNEDPDSFVRQFGKDGFLHYKEKHETDFVGFIVQNAKNELKWENPRKKQQVITQILQLISTVPNQIEQEFMIQKLHELSSINIKTLFNELGGLIQTQKRKQRIENRQINSSQNNEPNIGQFENNRPQINDSKRVDTSSQNPNIKAPKYEYEILKLILIHGEMMLAFANNFIKKEYFEDLSCGELFGHLLTRFMNEEDFSLTYFMKNESNFKVLVSNIVFDQYEVSEKGREILRANYDEKKSPFKQMKSAIKSLELSYLQRDLTDLEKRLKSATDIENKKTILTSFNNVTKRISKLRGNINTEKLYPNPDWLVEYFSKENE